MSLYKSDGACLDHDLYHKCVRKPLRWRVGHWRPNTWIAFGYGQSRPFDTWAEAYAYALHQARVNVASQPCYCTPVAYMCEPCSVYAHFIWPYDSEDSVTPTERLKSKAVLFDRGPLANSRRATL